MKVYYQDKFATIYHGSAEEILPALPAVAAIVTDPPYGIGENSKRAKTRGNLAPAGIKYGEFDWGSKQAT